MELVILLRHQLLALQQQLRQAERDVFTRHRLRRMEGLVLLEVERMPGIYAIDIARRLRLSKGHMSEIVRSLVRKRLLWRLTTTGRNGIMILRLTRWGKELIPHLHRDLELRLHGLLAALQPGERGRAIADELDSLAWLTERERLPLPPIPPRF